MEAHTSEEGDMDVDVDVLGDQNLVPSTVFSQDVVI